MSKKPVLPPTPKTPLGYLQKSEAERRSADEIRSDLGVKADALIITKALRVDRCGNL